MLTRIRAIGARRALPLLLLIGLLAWILSAFTASNTVDTSKAGDGTNTVSGYTVSSVVYSLNSTNPQNIDAVAFTRDTAPPSGATKKVRLVSSSSTWYTCTNSSTSVTCTTTSPQATVATADELRVVVAQ